MTKTKRRLLKVMAELTGPAHVRYIATKMRSAPQDEVELRFNETHEAMMALKRDGLVVSVPGRGWRLVS